MFLQNYKKQEVCYIDKIDENVKTIFDDLFAKIVGSLKL